MTLDQDVACLSAFLHSHRLPAWTSDQSVALLSTFIQGQRLPSRLATCGRVLRDRIGRRPARLRVPGYQDLHDWLRSTGLRGQVLLVQVMKAMVEHLMTRAVAMVAAEVS